MLYQLSYPSDERVMGIEPTCAAWKAAVLPLNYTRKTNPLNGRTWRLYQNRHTSGDLRHTTGGPAWFVAGAERRVADSYWICRLRITRSQSTTYWRYCSDGSWQTKL